MDASDRIVIVKIFIQIDLIRLLIDKIEKDAENIRQIHSKMLEPMADARKNALSLSEEDNVTVFVFSFDRTHTRTR